jgi:ribosomal protein S12 methylthiotransferase accessory factor
MDKLPSWWNGDASAVTVQRDDCAGHALVAMHYCPIMSVMTVSFPGGVMVDATFRGLTVRTDQPESAGGTNTALSPFDLFLASIATCMGYYALRFCQERDLSTEGLRLTLEPMRDEDLKRVATLRIVLELPTQFPDKYRPAIARAVDHCAVKKHILEPPRFELIVENDVV